MYSAIQAVVEMGRAAGRRPAIQQNGVLRYTGGIAIGRAFRYCQNVHRSAQSERVEPVNYQLRASGVKEGSQDPLRSGIHNRGYLPHVKREGAVYFVTFRLADSLPKQVLMKLMAEKAQRLRRAEHDHDVQTAEMIERDYTREIERHLDRGVGECVLRRPEVADLVAQALRFFDGNRYQLRAWVVMPNHVHVLLWPAPNHTITAIVKSWKSFTGLQANRLLKRVGQTFWQRESYDHWVRNDDEHLRCCRYIHNNPVKAGLCRSPEEWRWSSAWRTPV